MNLITSIKPLDQYLTGENCSIRIDINIIIIVIAVVLKHYQCLLPGNDAWCKKLKKCIKQNTQGFWWNRKTQTLSFPKERYKDQFPLWEIQKAVKRLLPSRWVRNQLAWSPQEDLWHALTAVCPPHQCNSTRLGENSQLPFFPGEGKRRVDQISNNWISGWNVKGYCLRECFCLACLEVLMGPDIL